MHFRSDVRQLRKAAELLSGIALRKSAVPVFEAVEIECSHDVALLRASDAVTYVEVEVPAEVLVDGRCCVNAAKFAKVLKTGKADSQVEIRIDSQGGEEMRDEGTLNITYGNSQYRVPCLYGERIPCERGYRADSYSFKIGKENLHALSLLRNYLAKDTIGEHVLSNAYVEVVLSDSASDGASVLAFATQGHMLAKYHTWCSRISEEQGKFVVMLPHSALYVFSLAETSGECAYRDGWFYYKSGNIRMAVLHNADYKYPEVRNFFILISNWMLRLRTDDMLSALSALKKVSKDVYTEFDIIDAARSQNGEPRLALRNDSGATDIPVEILHNTDEGNSKIAFNSKYLHRIFTDYKKLKHSVVMHIKDENNHVLFLPADEEERSGFFEVVLMPMLLRD